MGTIQYRQAQHSDIPAMAEIRSADWGTQLYWEQRIQRYLAHESHPRQALRPRVAFIALDGERVVGFIAGHLTRRYGCDGELEWVSVRHEYRKLGIATDLLGQLAKWFLSHHARRLCVDVETHNEPARRFYERRGAVNLKPHWMWWEDISVAVRSASSPT